MVSSVRCDLLLFLVRAVVGNLDLDLPLRHSLLEDELAALLLIVRPRHGRAILGAVLARDAPVASSQ